MLFFGIKSATKTQLNTANMNLIQQAFAVVLRHGQFLDGDSLSAVVDLDVFQQPPQLHDVPDEKTSVAKKAPKDPVGVAHKPHIIVPGQFVRMIFLYVSKAPPRLI